MVNYKTITIFKAMKVFIWTLYHDEYCEGYGTSSIYVFVADHEDVNKAKDKLNFINLNITIHHTFEEEDSMEGSKRLNEIGIYQYIEEVRSTDNYSCFLFDNG